VEIAIAVEDVESLHFAKIDEARQNVKYTLGVIEMVFVGHVLVLCEFQFDEIVFRSYQDNMG
jgi:hypothetical protein